MLGDKYKVTLKKTGEEVRECFVLEPWYDEAAFQALVTYFEKCTNKELADEINGWLGIIFREKSR